MAVWRLSVGDGERLAIGPAVSGPSELLAPTVTIDGMLDAGPTVLADVSRHGTGEPVPDGAVVLAPLGTQEIWAAGVTYRRSRDARMEESEDPDHYDKVYEADRPELFFKSTAARTSGPGEPIGVRADSTWDVPEAELGLVLDTGGAIVGYVVGDDVSSRSIEGENPLYLPQAKSYTGSCAVGPCIVPVAEAQDIRSARIELQIDRDGEVLYADEVPLAQMHRDPAELADWLFRALEFPVGVVLLTGTALIPPSEVTLLPGDVAHISIDGLGRLSNPVELVGRSTAATR